MGLSDADLRRIERRATLLAVGMELPLVPSQVLKARVEAALRLEARRAAALLARAQQAEADAARLRAASARVVRAQERLLACVAEFEPEHEGVCYEWAEAVDTAIAELAALLAPRPGEAALAEERMASRLAVDAYHRERALTARLQARLAVLTHELTWTAMHDIDGAPPALCHVVTRARALLGYPGEEVTNDPR